MCHDYTTLPLLSLVCKFVCQFAPFFFFSSFIICEHLCIRKWCRARLRTFSTPKVSSTKIKFSGILMTKMNIYIRFKCLI